MSLPTTSLARGVLCQVVFRVGIVLLSSSQEQLLGMPFEKLVAALNSRKFPVLDRHPDALMKVRRKQPAGRPRTQLAVQYSSIPSRSVGSPVH